MSKKDKATQAAVDSAKVTAQVVNDYGANSVQAVTAAVGTVYAIEDAKKAGATNADLLRR